MADLPGGHGRRPPEAHAAAAGVQARAGAQTQQAGFDYLDKSGRASRRSTLRESASERIVLVVVAPFPMEDPRRQLGVAARRRL